MNIVLVVFDTLRKDCVGCYGESPGWTWLEKYGPVQTPHLDAFAAKYLQMGTVPCGSRIISGYVIDLFLILRHPLQIIIQRGSRLIIW